MAESNTINEMDGFNWKTLLQKARLQGVDEDGYKDITDLLHSQIQEKYEKHSQAGMLNHEELIFQRVRPEMPFDFWQPDVLLSKKKVTQQPQPKERTVLDECLTEVSIKEARFPLNVEGSIIQKKVEIVMEKLLVYLKENFLMFRNSSLLYTGSMYEGLKIQKVDEFDFMIEVPELMNAFEVDCRCNKEMLSITMVDLRMFEDLPINKVSFDVSAIQQFFDARESKTQRKSGKQESKLTEKIIKEAEFYKEDPSNAFNVAIILRTLAILIEEKLQDYLTGDGQVLQRESKNNLLSMKNNCTQSSAFTYDLLFGDKLVNIDVALALPIRNLSLLINKRNIGSKHFPEDFEERFQKHPIVHHAIFRNSSTLRISLSCKEKEKLVSFPVDDPRKICIRLVKFLRKKFITHLKWGDEEASCLLNSYHIKTVFFFLFQKYPEDKYWNLNCISSRIVEVFSVLKKCFEKRILESFFIPNYNILKKYFATKPNIICQDADIVVNDIQHLLHLFSDMEKLDFDSAMKFFYGAVNAKKPSLIKVPTDEEKNKRQISTISSNLF